MEKLILDNGQVQFGHFPSSPKLINFSEFDLRNNMDRPVNGLRKKMGFNQFQFIGLTGDDFILGVAIVSLKWVSNCFMYIYQPSTKSFKEYSWLKPLSMGLKTSNEPNGGIWSFKSGKTSVTIECKDGKRHLDLAVGKELSANVIIDESQNYDPLAVCCRAGYSGWVFTQKSTALNFEGKINWQGQDINTDNMLASVDWSCGYMRRETFWMWASLSTRTKDGRQVGMNLAAGVNETSYTENGLWVDGKLIKLDRAEFIFDRNNRLNQWQVKTSDGRIDLTFTPVGERKEKINAGFIASNFTQLFGHFNGSVKDSEGNSIKLENVTGFCEDHFAKW